MRKAIGARTRVSGGWGEHARVSKMDRINGRQLASWDAACPESPRPVRRGLTCAVRADFYGLSYDRVVT
jgi:hypothetical protein